MTILHKTLLTFGLVCALAGAAHAQNSADGEDGGGALIVPGQEPDPPAPPSAAPA